MDKRKKNIFLIGFMGVGKSTIAEELGRKPGRSVVEMDQVIADRQHMEIPDIFAEYGENYFRKLETDLLEELAGKRGQVISCGGGVVLREKNVRIMKEQGCIILLTANPETIYERVKNSSGRPILNNHMSVDYIEELMEERGEKYREAADLTIATDGKSADEITSEICTKLEFDRH